MGLLSQHRATGSSYGAGALGQEVSHGLGRLLCLSETFRKSFDCQSKEATGGNRGIKEGNLICVEPSRSRWFQLRGVSTASRLPGSVRDEVVIVADGEDINNMFQYFYFTFHF